MRRYMMVGLAILMTSSFAAAQVITTVAGDGIYGFSGDGGAAINANLGRPNGVAVDAAGNLFIADTNNSRVRRVDVATGVITTAAGGGIWGNLGDGGWLPTRA